MGWPLASDLVEPWLRAMGRASLYGGLAIAGTWLLCRSLPRMSPKVRSWIWRLVYLKLILLILWPNPIPMQLLPSPAVRLERAHAPAAPAAPARVSALEQQMPTVSRIPTLLTGRRSVQESERHTTRLPSIALCVVWLVGILLAAITTLRVTLVTRKTVRES